MDIGVLLVIGNGNGVVIAYYLDLGTISLTTFRFTGARAFGGSG
jgi:hypothetical protein